MMVFRVLMLVLVSFLGCLAYYSRVQPEIPSLLRLAGRQTSMLCLWMTVAFGAMNLVEWLWIDP